MPKKTVGSRTFFSLIFASLLAVLMLSGFEYTFEFSVLMVVFSIFEYDPPKTFLGGRSRYILGRRNCRAFGLVTAGFCGLNIMSGNLILTGTRRLANYLIYYPYADLEVSFMFLWEAAILLIVSIAVVGGYGILLTRRHSGTYREPIERMLGGSVALLVFAFFFGLCGETIVSWAVSIAVGAFAIRSLARVRKPKELMKAIQASLEKEDELDRSVWVRWLETGRTAQNQYLFGLLFVVTFLSVNSISFFDYTELIQIVFVALLLTSLFLAYLGLKGGNRGWEFCLLASTPLLVGVTISLAKFEAVPFFGLLLSTAETWLGAEEAKLLRADMAPYIYALNIFFLTMIVYTFLFSIAGEAKWKDLTKYRRLSLCGRAVFAAGTCLVLTIILSWMIGLAIAILMFIVSHIIGRREEKLISKRTPRKK